MGSGFARRILTTGYSEDIYTPAIQVQTLPLEGPWGFLRSVTYNISQKTSSSNHGFIGIFEGTRNVTGLQERSE